MIIKILVMHKSKCACLKSSKVMKTLKSEKNKSRSLIMAPDIDIVN